MAAAASASTVRTAVEDYVVGDRAPGRRRLRRYVAVQVTVQVPMPPAVPRKGRVSEMTQSLARLARRDPVSKGINPPPPAASKRPFRQSPTPPPAPARHSQLQKSWTDEGPSEQSELYESLGQVLLRGAAQGLLASTVDAPELEEGRTHQQRRSAAIFLALHRLQQVCNHPAALPPEHRPDNCPKAAKASGKTAKLIELLGAIWEAEPQEGPLQKALIFTQYRGTQDLLVELLQAHFPNFRAVPFHGSLSADERDKAVRDFSKDPHCRTMVLTLKAGGVGLTLTAASHVLLGN
ncbi:putative ATP-dependent helicase YwqA [Symbiodinium microadriaticum]|uniref:Putative ATP-dependent helicase YwqA n=1 Tax=Symbiodinium microadriaticum TaxID=2951 RepID=A0A1Q9DX46_SYMMI|nr:putative ATP-dependent helicase YwqA [Symbiodinium microadriaticum]